MLKKFVVALVAISFIVSQGMFFAPRLSAAENVEMLELATRLPESDIVMAMDFDRTLNVAAANILNNDAQKIENLKSVMKTIENQIGFSPYEIKQIAVGIKLPPGGVKDPIKDKDLDFAAIVRTNLPNGNMLDIWSKRMEAIYAFNEEKEPTRFYVEEFRSFRDRKFTRATPEKIAESVKNLEESIKKTKEIGAAIEAMPKTSVTPAALNEFRKSNQDFTATLNKYVAALKADTDTKNYRSETIKLLNRWNALSIDDAQRSAKLAAIKKESESIYPAYKKKFAAAQKLENLMEKIEESSFMPDALEWTASINEELDKINESLKTLPAAKLKKSAELKSLGQSYGDLNSKWDETLQSVEAENFVAPEEVPNVEATVKKSTKGFYELMKQAQTEQTVGGKRMVRIDLAKLNPEPPTEKKESTEPTDKKEEKTEDKKDEMPNIGVGFLDENRMVIGMEKSVTAVLKQDANYKNQKAAAMLENGKSALFAFAVSSNLAKKVSEEAAKTSGKTSAASAFDGFFKDINLYGSVNYDGTSSTTNDISMTLGFSRENVEAILPAQTGNGADADNTFEIGGYQFGKALFYDLFNSFKAMQASVTFKFEKKKIASLLKSTPRILDNIAAKETTAKKTKSVKQTKSRRIDSIQELLTAPKVYVDLVKIFEGKNG